MCMKKCGTGGVLRGWRWRCGEEEDRVSMWAGLGITTAPQSRRQLV